MNVWRVRRVGCCGRHSGWNVYGGPGWQTWAGIGRLRFGNSFFVTAALNVGRWRVEFTCMVRWRIPDISGSAAHVLVIAVGALPVTLLLPADLLLPFILLWYAFSYLRSWVL